MIDICNMLQTKGKTKILFVCLGNICRSSSAEGVMKQLIEQAGREDEFIIDSAGILSYHQGELPDSRMRAHAARRGYDLTHRSRPVCTDDFYDFDLIIGMDDRNIDDLKDRAPSVEAWKKIHRMTDIARSLLMLTTFPTLIMVGPRVLNMCSMYWKMLVRDYSRWLGAMDNRRLSITNHPIANQCLYPDKSVCCR